MRRRTPSCPSPVRVAGLCAALLVLVVAALVVVSGCGDGGIEFEAPAEDDMRDRVHLEATATLDASTLPWALEQARYAAAFAAAFVQFTTVYAENFAGAAGGSSALGSGLEISPFGAGSPYAVAESALTYSATGYIRFSCPGADLANPDYTFDKGDARVESPGVTNANDIATLEAGSVFVLQFRDGCRVGGDSIGGVVYGLFETPWVLVADVTETIEGVGKRDVEADIELAANRTTVILYDSKGGIFKVIVTHPEGAVTSARIEGVNAKCTIGVERDPQTGAYLLNDELPNCDF